MNSKNMIIGIDPDLEKSGVAVINGNDFTVFVMDFNDLIDHLRANKDRIKKVVIEAGWLNKKSNFHSISTNQKLTAYQKLATCEKIAKNVGENHATGKLLAHMAEKMGLEVQLIKPYATKKDKDQFKRITGFNGRTNSEMRDAGMLIWGMK